MPTLPISSLLRQAAPESIADLFSRDVEGMEDTDIDRIILEQRLNRERVEAAEAAGIKPARAAKAAKEPKITGIKSIPQIDSTFLDI